MSLILVTTANRGYMERITPFLHTIQQHAGDFDARCLITAGCQVEMPVDLDTIAAYPLPTAAMGGHPGNGCIQHGAFLRALPGEPDDVIVLVDGDVRMQRAPTDDELAWMRVWPLNTIGLGYNAGRWDTLAYEAQRIGLADTALYADVLHEKVYNCGVMIMRRATWGRLYAAYMTEWPQFDRLSSHYARNQFLQCVVAHRLGLYVWELPATLHSHGCFGLPDGARELDDDGTLAIGGELVLFRHHWKC